MTEYAKVARFLLNGSGKVNCTSLPCFVESTNGALNLEIDFPGELLDWTKGVKIQLYSGTVLDSGDLGSTNSVEYQPPATWMIRGNAVLQFYATSSTNEWYSELFPIEIIPAIPAAS